VKLATHLRSGIRAVRGSDYFVTQIFELYPTSGSATEWMWSRHLTDASKPRIESFAIEIAGAESDNPLYYGFQPVVAQKDEIVREVTFGLINFCLAIGPTTVPYVRELKHGVAGAQVMAAGLVPRFTGVTPTANVWVYTQSPSGGTIVRRGDTVTMNLRVGPIQSQTMKEEHGGPGLFQRAGEFPMSTDLQYPMAQIAVDYYKDGPSLLAKYLPFRMAIYARRTIALLIATLAIVLPVFGFAPRLYGWFVQERLRKLYRRLRVVENAMQVELTIPQAEALQSHLVDIDRVASAVPMRHSDLFFIFRYHLDQTRSRLAARLAEAQNRKPKSVKV
jgi:hypothetical protein